MASNETFDQYMSVVFDRSSAICEVQSIVEMLTTLGYARENALADFLIQNKNARLALLDFLQDEVIYQKPEWEAKLKARVSQVEHEGQ